MACTVSANELGIQYDTYHGTSLAYMPVNIGVKYWVRQTYYDGRPFMISDAGSFAVTSATNSRGVRPCIGVSETKVSAEKNESNGYYYLSKSTTPPHSLSINYVEGGHLENVQINSYAVLTWPAAVGQVSGYYIQRAGSDGTTRLFGPYTSCSAYVEAPSRGYSSYTYTLWTSFTDGGSMINTEMTCKLSTKNSKIYAYEEVTAGAGPIWRLGVPKYYTGTGWVTDPDGMYYFTDPSNKIRLYGTGSSGNVPTNYATVENFESAQKNTFQENEDGYWESQNSEQNNSYAICKVKIVTDGTKEVIFICQHSGEGGTAYPYDYGMLSTVGAVFSSNASAESSDKVHVSFGGLNYADVDVRVSYGILPAGTHYVYAKYIKDGSVSNLPDSLRFKVVFE